MTEPLPQNFCPYKGLQPYTEADRAFFFGRERDSEIIASNLYAAPLTVLYGESGVGKSSVLLAGVVPLLHQTPNTAVVVFRLWQDAQFASMLKAEVLKAVGSAAAGREAKVDLSLPLDEFLIACNRILRGPIFFIFDQFEEFFLYHAASHGAAEGFEAEWARAVNRQDVDANFLISLREDSLSRLDRFRGRMPKLMGNMLRLKHLDEAAARTAITEPLEKYNEMIGAGEPSVRIEEPLVETLLREIETGRVTLGALGGRGNSHEGGERGEGRIETPFLQMVLTRLWDEEMAEGSRVLRLQTLNALGGAERIIRTHLDKVMEKLSDTQRDVSAQLFRFLVTPSGSKIAHTTSDLISYAETSPESVEPVLKLLGSPDVRVLRPIAPPPGQSEGTRYEIFHDVLAQAVLDWRTRYMQEQRRLAAERERTEERRLAEAKLREAQQRARRLWWGAAGLTVILIVTALLLGLVLRQSNALAQAQVDSHSRELAAYSKDNADYDPDLSLLLAIESARVSMTEEARSALKRSILAEQTWFVLRGHEGAVRGAAFSPDGKFVATSSWDKTARVWEAATGKLVGVLGGHDGPVPYVAFSPDGQLIVTASHDRKARVWSDWQSGSPRVIATLEEPGQLWSATFSPDGRYILTGGDKILHSWDWKAAVGAQKPHELPVSLVIFDAVFSPDGRYVVAAAQGGSVMFEWNGAAPAASKPVQLLPRGTAYRTTFSRDGNYVGARCGDNVVCLWEWKSAEARDSPLQLSKSLLGIRGVAFGQGDELVATGQEDGTVLLWRWRAANEEERVKPHLLLGHVGDNSMIHSLAFSPDGQFLLSASEDKTARIWNLKELDPNQLERLTPDELLRLAESRVVRPFTQQERERYLRDPQ